MRVFELSLPGAPCTGHAPSCCVAPSGGAVAARGPVLQTFAVDAPPRPAPARRPRRPSPRPGDLRGDHELPIVSPHGHVPRRCSRTTGPSATRPASWSPRTTTCCACSTARACRWRHLGVRARRRRRAEASTAERSGGPSPSTTACSGAPRRSCGSTTPSPRSSASPVALGADTADAIYDDLVAALADDAFRPRALFERFGIELLASTDARPRPARGPRRDPRLAGGTGRVVPTFRPDDVVDPDRPDFAAQPGPPRRADRRGHHDVGRLPRRPPGPTRGASSRPGPRPATTATRPRRPRTSRRAEAEALFAPGPRRARRARRRRAVPGPDARRDGRHERRRRAGAAAPRRVVARPQPRAVRPVRRATRAPTSPSAMDYVGALKPLLDRFGNEPGLTVVVYTLDESTYSRELAPLAGHYPALRLGPPWWFHDSPEGIRRFRQLVTETAGFANTVGFNDDARSLLSIPARHDMARRIDAGFLAGLVAEHRLEEDEAVEVAADLAYRLAATRSGSLRRRSPSRPLTAPTGDATCCDRRTTSAREAKRLDGLWDFTIDPDGVGPGRAVVDGAAPRAPGRCRSRRATTTCWSRRPSTTTSATSGTSARSSCPPGWDGRRIVLRFDAAMPPGDGVGRRRAGGRARGRLHAVRGRHHPPRRAGRAPRVTVVVNNELTWQSIPPGVDQRRPDGTAQAVLLPGLLQLRRAASAASGCPRRRRPTSTTSPW